MRSSWANGGWVGDGTVMLVVVDSAGFVVRLLRYGVAETVVDSSSPVLVLMDVAVET
jgi:hypothetical protein